MYSFAACLILYRCDARYARLCFTTLFSSIIYFWDSNNKSNIFGIIKIYVL